jgi:hypothetical protein
VILLLTAYIIRFTTGSDIVVFAPEESIFYKIFLKVRDLFLQ